MKDFILNGISGKAKSPDGTLRSEEQETKSEDLNPQSQTVEKDINSPAQELDRSSIVSSAFTYWDGKISREAHNELDLENNIAILTYEGELKEYSKSVVKNAQKLIEKELRNEEEGWKSLFPRGLVAIIIGMLIFKKYPILAVIAIIYGFYEMEKLASLDNSLVLEYLAERRCKKCGKNLAYDEIKKPEVREISTPQDYKINIKRFRKCKYCGHESIEEGSEGFFTRKTKVNDTLRKSLGMRPKCSKCRRVNAYEEFREADTRIKDPTSTTIRYYRCRYCENIELSIESVNIGLVQGG